MCSPSLSFIIRARLTGKLSICAAQEGVFYCCWTQNCIIEGCTSQFFLLPPPVPALILEMFSVANKSIMWSYTCSICKWIALPILPLMVIRKTLNYERTNSHPILSVIVWILSDGDVGNRGMLYVNWMACCLAIWVAIRYRHMKQQEQIILKL